MKRAVLVSLVLLACGDDAAGQPAQRDAEVEPRRDARAPELDARVVDATVEAAIDASEPTDAWGDTDTVADAAERDAAPAQGDASDVVQASRSWASGPQVITIDEPADAFRFELIFDALSSGGNFRCWAELTTRVDTGFSGVQTFSIVGPDRDCFAQKVAARDKAQACLFSSWIRAAACRGKGADVCGYYELAYERKSTESCDVLEWVDGVYEVRLRVTELAHDQHVLELELDTD